MLDTLKPGQTIRCTITRDIRTADDRETVLRLMRFDPTARRTLKSAQKHRVRTLVIRNRGKRPWEARVKSARQVRAVKGASWTMRWFPQVARDFAAVARFLDVKAA